MAMLHTWRIVIKYVSIVDFITPTTTIEFSFVQCTNVLLIIQSKKKCPSNNVSEINHFFFFIRRNKSYCFLRAGKSIIS